MRITPIEALLAIGLAAILARLMGVKNDQKHTAIGLALYQAARSGTCEGNQYDQLMRETTL